MRRLQQLSVPRHLRQKPPTDPVSYALTKSTAGVIFWPIDHTSPLLAGGGNVITPGGPQVQSGIVGIGLRKARAVKPLVSTYPDPPESKKCPVVVVTCPHLCVHIQS